MKTKPTMFPDIIGQEPAKKKLEFLIKGYKRTSILPHLMFIAPNSFVKTMNFTDEKYALFKKLFDAPNFDIK